MAEGVKAAAPDVSRERTALHNLLTAGQTAGRSGRDPQHVALSSHAACTLSAHMISVVAGRTQPWQLLERLLDMLTADLPRAVAGSFLE